MIKIKIMKNDEKFHSISGNNIILTRKNGETRIVKVIQDENGLRIDTDNELIIGYGNNIVECKDKESGIEVTTF